METKNLTYNIQSNAQTFIVTMTALVRDKLGESGMFNLDPSVFNSLRVLLVSPNTSGAVRLTEDATRPCYYEIIDSQDLHIHLSELAAGVHRLTILSIYGTYTRSLLTVDVVVPTEAGNEGAPINIDVQTVNALVGVLAGDFTSLQDEVDEAKEEIAGKADGSIYQVGVSGDPVVRDVAKIIGHGLEVGTNAEATGLQAVAMGDGIASGSASLGHGYAYNGSQIEATSDGAHAHGSADNGATILATERGAHAGGYGDSADSDQDILAGGTASFAHGVGVKTEVRCQTVFGEFNVIDTDGEYAFIIGNGTSDSARSNAFAVTKTGNFVLFNNGAPVVLTPAKLAQLIA